MTDHLPECPLLEPCDDEVPEHGYCSMQQGVFCIHCHQWCICDRLRACEQRVAIYEFMSSAYFAKARRHLIGQTLDAVREAVDGCCVLDSVDTEDDEFLPGSFLDQAEVLAAIDALREVDTAKQQTNEHINLEQQ